MLILSNLNFNKNEAQNMLLHKLGSAPSSPASGQVYYNTGDNHPYYHNGSGFQDLTNALSLGGTAAASYALLASPTFTGVPLAPTAASGTNTTQIATTAYVITEIAARLASNDAMRYMGAIDASGNPNYPAADAGDTYRISVAGKIGGASGPDVEVGFLIISHVDGSAAGNHATVGANWDVIPTNIDGALTITDIGSTVQAYSANLDEYATVNPTAAGLALLDDADAAAQRTTLGLATTANQTDSTDKRFMTDAQETKLDSVESGADVTDAANVEAAGAVMTSDTATTGFFFVIDEDDFNTDSDTKVPTQQSTKAYIDAQIAGVGGGVAKYSEDVGDNSSTAIVITHNLNTRDIVVSVRDTGTPWAVVICDVEATSVNTVTLRFAVAPTTAQYRVVVVG